MATVASEVFTIENAVISYPHLWAVDGNGKYSASLLITPDQQQIVLQQAQLLAQRAYQQGEQNLPQFGWPGLVKAHDKMNTQGGFTYRDHAHLADRFILSSSSQADRPAPKVEEFGPAGIQLMVDRGNLYPGAVVAALIRLFTYSAKGNIGIGVGLQAILKQGDGPSIGGSGTVDTAKGFAQVKAIAPVPGMTPPGGAPLPTSIPANPLGQPAAPGTAGLPAAPFGIPGLPM